MPNRNRFSPGWWILFGVILGVLFWVALVALVAMATAAPANQSLADVRNGTLTVRNDYGGPLDERYAFLDAIRANGVQVRVTGQHCVSACTLYLAHPPARFDPEPPGATSRD